MQLGFTNEADTFKSSSVLIYQDTEQSIYTQIKLHDAALIKMKLFEEGWEVARYKLIM